MVTKIFSFSSFFISWSNRKGSQTHHMLAYTLISLKSYCFPSNVKILTAHYLLCEYELRTIRIVFGCDSTFILFFPTMYCILNAKCGTIYFYSSNTSVFVKQYLLSSGSTVFSCKLSFSLKILAALGVNKKTGI